MEKIIPQAAKHLASINHPSELLNIPGQIARGILTGLVALLPVSDFLGSMITTVDAEKAVLLDGAIAGQLFF